MSDVAKYAALLSGVAAALVYAAAARRRIRRGAGRGIYHPRALGGMAVLILWLVGMLVGIVVEASLGNL